MTTTNTTQKANGSPGQIGDAASSFEGELIAAAKAAGKEDAGDPRVRAALQLGWVMASVLSATRQVPLPTNFPIFAETVDKARAIELVTLLNKIGVSVQPGPDAVTGKLEAGQDASGSAQAWEDTLVAALLGSDIRLAKAYGIGRELNMLAYSPASTANPFRSEPANAMLASLDDLSTVLPPHAARGVADSVRRWQAATERPDRTLLEAQGELWRTVLTGEKKCAELLEPENYLDAAERFAVKLRAVGTSLLKRYSVWVALVVILFLGGGAILLFVHGAAGKTVAGLSAVLAALGLTWKGLGTTLGKLAGQLEAPLWGAEVDGAVTDAITIGIAAAPKRAPSVWQRRRRVTTGDYAGRARRLPGVNPPSLPPASRDGAEATAPRAGAGADTSG